MNDRLQQLVRDAKKCRDRLLAGGEGECEPAEEAVNLRPDTSDDLEISALAETLGPVPPDVLGRYRLIRPLGLGGMGQVYLAEDTQLKREVALKFPRFASGDESGTLLKRFYREARAAAQLNHAGLCPVHDVGELEGFHFIAMEYVHGRPLNDYIDSDRKFGRRKAASLARKVALAMEHAHARGLIHRDLKPDNIMIDGRGRPVVTDFGLSHLSGDPSTARLTRPGRVVGTPAYIAPEMLLGETLTPAADIYSLGIIMYEMLAGRAPFEGPGPDILEKAITGDPPPLQQYRPDVQAALSAIVHKAMARRPEKRYRTMNHLAEALDDYLEARNDETSAPPRTRKAVEPASSRPAPVDDVYTPLGPLGELGPFGGHGPREAGRDDAERPSRWRPLLLVAGCAAALGAVASVGLWAFSRPAADAPVKRDVPGFGRIDLAAPFGDLDADGDGRVGPHEYPVHVIRRADADRDGLLTARELREARRKAGRRLYDGPGR